MIWVDYAILVAVALSAIVGFFRGFAREAVGLATWVIAFWLAFRFSEPAAVLLDSLISVRSVRLAIAFGTIFLSTLILGAIMNYLVSRLVSGTGFAGTDRSLGGLFGVLRGVAVLVVLVLLAGLTPVPGDAWWQKSVFVGHLERGALWLRDWLPRDIAGAIRYQDAEESTPTPEKT